MVCAWSAITPKKRGWLRRQLVLPAAPEALPLISLSWVRGHLCAEFVSALETTASCLMADGNSSGKLLNRKARPRVAALGSWTSQGNVLDSIEPLCGALYRDSLPNLKEVDLVISRGYLDEPLPAHVLIWGPDSAHEIRRPSQETWIEAASLKLWDIEDEVPTPLQFAN